MNHDKEKSQSFMDYFGDEVCDYLHFDYLPTQK